MSSDAGVEIVTVTPEVRCKLSDLLCSNWKIILGVMLLVSRVVPTVVLNDRGRGRKCERCAETGAGRAERTGRRQSPSSGSGYQLHHC